jgi:hypothetical protein
MSVGFEKSFYFFWTGIAKTVGELFTLSWLFQLVGNHGLCKKCGNVYDLFDRIIADIRSISFLLVGFK